MKAKVIIENSQTKIVLTPENNFETDIVEKLKLNTNQYSFDTNIYGEYNFGNALKDLRIEINLIKNK